MRKGTTRLVPGLVLSAALSITGGFAADNCDLVFLSVNNNQFDPAGAFVGTTELTFLHVDPATGVTAPTGETLTIECSVSALAFFPDLEYETSHDCVGPRGSRVQFTASHTGRLVPLENDPDGYEFGFVDSGDIVSGKGRWNCGGGAVGIDPGTGEFNARGRLWTPDAPGEFVGTGLARWCDCSDQDQ